MMNILKISFIAMCIIEFSTAEENKMPLLGTWSGTIGKAKINVCFQVLEGSYYNDGSYYYLKYLIPIRLNHVNDKLWEEPDSNKWVFESITDSSAEGKWVSHKGDVSLPIKLKLLGDCDQSEEKGGSPCGCDLFNNPIEKMPQVIIDTVKEPNNRYFRKLSLVSGGIQMEWFELCSGGEVANKINKEIGNRFPDLKNGAKDFYSCRRNTLVAFGTAECEDNMNTEPYLWTDKFLEISEAEGGFCGGAHDFGGIQYRTFDLATGEQIDPKSWLAGGISDELNRLILSKNVGDTSDPHEKECFDMLNENTTYSIKIDSTGLVFYTTFGHCCRACDEEFLLTYQELMSFFSEEGNAEVKRLFKFGK